MDVVALARQGWTISQIAAELGRPPEDMSVNHSCIRRRSEYRKFPAPRSQPRPWPRHLGATPAGVCDSESLALDTGMADCVAPSRAS